MNKRIYFTLILAAIFTSIFGQDPSALRKKQFNLEDNIAIEGYDPVAYFKNNKAVKGKKEFAVSHQGVIYYFASAENKEEFKKTGWKVSGEKGAAKILGLNATTLEARMKKLGIKRETHNL